MPASLPAILLLPALLCLPVRAGGQEPAAATAAAAVQAYYAGEPESAARIYREILKADPWDLAARRALVRLLREGGRPREALGHLELLILLRPREPELALQAAEAALLAGKAERALGYLPDPDAAAEADPQVAAKADTLAGLALRELGRPEEAAACLERSVQRQDFQPQAWYRLGQIRYELGELERAEEALTTALAQEPNLTGCLPLLARIHLAQGRVQQAHALARRALAGQPESLPLQELLRELEEAQPSLAQEAGRQLELRREQARPRRAEALPADAASLPLLRIGLAEQVRELFLMTGGSWTASAAPGGTEAEKRSGPGGQLLCVRPQGAEVELSGPDGQVLLRSAGPLRLSYEDPADTTILFDLSYGQGAFWAGSEDRLYRGEIELLPRAEGLTAVNLLTIEEYLYSVLPSEMPSHWPRAALEAQAVAARSYTLANLGRFSSRGFDLLGDVTSAAYRGLGAESPAARAAVDATRGQVLVEEGRPLAAYYSANCGGHTEGTQGAWGFPSSLPAAPDPLQGRRAGLLDPEELARWLSTRPAAYCAHPAYSARSAYRWQLWVGRQELERRLEDPGLGSVRALLTAGRAPSGRVGQVRVLGTTGELTVRWDALRRRLGGLRSNLFVVEPKLGADGLPESFLFTGAGWGHGVGLCQSGAAAMAEVGWSSAEILRLYYGEATLQRQY